MTAIGLTGLISACGAIRGTLDSQSKRPDKVGIDGKQSGSDSLATGSTQPEATPESPISATAAPVNGSVQEAKLAKPLELGSQRFVINRDSGVTSVSVQADLSKAQDLQFALAPAMGLDVLNREKPLSHLQKANNDFVITIDPSMHKDGLYWIIAYFKDREAADQRIKMAMIDLISPLPQQSLRVLFSNDLSGSFVSDFMEFSFYLEGGNPAATVFSIDLSIDDGLNWTNQIQGLSNWSYRALPKRPDGARRLTSKARVRLVAESLGQRAEVISGPFSLSDNSVIWQNINVSSAHEIGPILAENCAASGCHNTKSSQIFTAESYESIGTPAGPLKGVSALREEILAVATGVSKALHLPVVIRPEQQDLLIGWKRSGFPHSLEESFFNIRSSLVGVRSKFVGYVTDQDVVADFSVPIDISISIRPLVPLGDPNPVSFDNPLAVELYLRDETRPLQYSIPILCSRKMSSDQNFVLTPSTLRDGTYALYSEVSHNGIRRIFKMKQRLVIPKQPDARLGDSSLFCP